MLDGVDRLQAEGVIDPQRLAIGGWSYGAYLSAWAVAHLDRLRTAIVGADVTDIGAMALSTDTPDYLQGYFGGPVKNPGEMLYRALKFNGTPVKMVVGYPRALHWFHEQAHGRDVQQRVPAWLDAHLRPAGATPAP